MLKLICHGQKPVNNEVPCRCYAACMLAVRKTLSLFQTLIKSVIVLTNISG